jgi:hypothetical protein
VNLPGPIAQALYLDAGWAIVLAAVAIALLGGRGARPGATLAACAAAAVAVSLPGPWSPSFWLGMAFQYPSPMLLALAGLGLLRRLRPAGPAGTARPGRAPRAAADAAPLLSTLPAATLLAIAIALYAGAFAFVPYDAYALGYLRFSGPAIATVLVLAWTALDRRSAPACAALAAAAALHAATRLPSGNAWDALLDPFLAAWAAFVVLCAVRERLRRRAPALITESVGERA